MPYFDAAAGQANAYDPNAGMSTAAPGSADYWSWYRNARSNALSARSNKGSANTGTNANAPNGGVEDIFHAPDIKGPDFTATLGAQMQAARAVAAGSYANFGDEAFRTGGAGGAARRSFMTAYGATQGERGALEAERGILGMQESQREFDSNARQRADELNLDKYKADQGNLTALIDRLLGLAGSGGPISEEGGSTSPSGGPPRGTNPIRWRI